MVYYTFNLNRFVINSEKFTSKLSDEPGRMSNGALRRSAREGESIKSVCLPRDFTVITNLLKGDEYRTRPIWKSCTNQKSR